MDTKKLEVYISEDKYQDIINNKVKHWGEFYSEQTEYYKHKIIIVYEPKNKTVTINEAKFDVLTSNLAWNSSINDLIQEIKKKIFE